MAAVLGRQNAPTVVCAPIGADGELSEFRLNPDGKTVAFFLDSRLEGKRTPYAGELVTLDYRANRELWRAPATEFPHSFQWSPDGKSLVVLASMPTSRFHIRVFDQCGGIRFENVQAGNAARFSPDSKKLAITYASSAKGNLFNRVEVHRFDD